MRIKIKPEDKPQENKVFSIALGKSYGDKLKDYCVKNGNHDPEYVLRSVVCQFLDQVVLDEQVTGKKRGRKPATISAIA